MLMLCVRWAGYNHSGKAGPINFLNGVMGLANAQRMLDYIRVITEFISQVRRSSSLSYETCAPDTRLRGVA